MGSFNSDSRGRWYVNLVVEVPKLTNLGNSVGIDLGLTSAATTSDGLKLVGRNFRKLEAKLASAQRAGKKKLVRKIHDKIKNRRKDGIEKFTTTVARENSLIVIGDVSSKKIIRKTNRFAKSASDASWYQIKSRLLNKAIRHGGRYMEVNEAYTSKTCSDCGTRWEFPKGLKSLAIREYVCPCCGVVQDRDINAARNILRIGHDSLNQEEFIVNSNTEGCQKRFAT